MGRLLGQALQVIGVLSTETWTSLGLTGCRLIGRMCLGWQVFVWRDFKQLPCQIGFHDCNIRTLLVPLTYSRFLKCPSFDYTFWSPWTCFDRHTMSLDGKYNCIGRITYLDHCRFGYHRRLSTFRKPSEASELHFLRQLKVALHERNSLMRRQHPP